MSEVTALVLAGGVGSRLRGVTTVPKPVVPVLGRPYLAYVLEALRYQGVRRAVISTGYRAEVVRRELERWNPGMVLMFSEEAEPLGTGGAVRRAAAEVGTERVLVLNGDSFCDTPLGPFFDFHEGHPERVSLLAVRVDDCSRYGGLTLAEGNRVAAFAEKREGAGPGWINAGVYLLPTELLRRLPDRKPLSLEQEGFPLWLEKGVFAFPVDAPFLDIGTPETYVLMEPFIAAMRRRRQEAAVRTMFGPFPADAGEAATKTGVGVLVLNTRGEVLLERRSDCGLWGLPGGRVEPGESVADTARREVREEAGIEVEIEGLFGVYSVPGTRILRYPDNGDMRHLIDIVLVARAGQGALALSMESDEMRYFPPHGLPPEGEIIPPAREPLRDFAAGRAGVLG